MNEPETQQKPRPDLPGEHGRPVQYDRGCRCTDCTTANTIKQRRSRNRRTTNKAAADRAGHGKASTYSNYRCRCQDCTKANADKSAHYRETKTRP